MEMTEGTRKGLRVVAFTVLILTVLIQWAIIDSQDQKLDYNEDWKQDVQDEIIGMQTCILKANSDYQVDWDVVCSSLGRSDNCSLSVSQYGKVEREYAEELMQCVE